MVAAAATPPISALSVDPRRGPVGGPRVPYEPEVFASLYRWWVSLVGVSLAMIVVGVALALANSEPTVLVLAMAISPLAMIAGAVVQWVFLYKAWNQIMDGYQRTSAGRAVGLCFVPFFNLYWVFVAFYGLTKDLNAYMRRYGIEGAPASEGLMLAWCILIVCGVVPYLGLLAVLASLMMTFVVLHQVKCVSVAIAEAKLRAEGA